VWPAREPSAHARSADGPRRATFHSPQRTPLSPDPPAPGRFRIRSQRLTASLSLRRVALFAALAAAAPAAAQRPNCANVPIDPAVLGAAPELRAACVAVTEREGRIFAVVNGEVTRAFTENALELRFALPGTATARPHLLSSAAADPVLTNGTASQVQNLPVGTRVAVLIDVTRPELALEPPAPDDPLALYPLQPSVAAPVYSRSTPAGTWLAGLVAILVGGALAAYRISRQPT
jgi:hypothetical protein